MFTTLDSLDTELSADSVEWCPAENYQDIFACGMYLLADDKDSSPNNEKDQQKIGRIYLMQVVEGGKLKTLQRIDCPAVFDMKWAHVKCYDKILLGVANSEGKIQIYELATNDYNVRLKLLTQESVLETPASDVSALSLDWSTGNRMEPDVNGTRISVSNSEGGITIFKFGENGKALERVNCWSAHKYEAWITAFDYWNTNIVYTGGDDSKLYRFDIRSGSHPISECRCHLAGVTSLHSNGRKDCYFVSGSYDEVLRTWDARCFRYPLSELKLSGGIWRLKWDPFWSKYLLAACMYGGFQIIDSQNLDAPKIVGNFKEHESIAYGSDWSYLSSESVFRKKLSRSEDNHNLLVGTCSFYDHLLKVLSVPLGKEV